MNNAYEKPAYRLSRVKGAFENLSGFKFGKLTVIESVGVFKKQRKWLCKCECGNTCTPSSASLKAGTSKACGCGRIEASKRRITHGLSRDKTHRAWTHMLDRCENPRCQKYEDYGGRGIKVCDRWKQFSFFLEDMGHAPDGLSIERINNDGNYEPSNCRWATRKEQQRNRRANVWLTLGSETMIAADWAIRLGIKHHTLIKRLKSGWSIERALSSKNQCG